LAFILFVGAALAAGRVWRFPFDDEVYTLETIERLSARALLIDFPRHADVHPALSYLIFSALQNAGMSEAGMRLCSLAMVALALALGHLLALTLIARRRGGAATPAGRIIAVLLFGLCPLAISQGDVLRWYPLFTLLVALFVTLYLAAGNGASRLWSAAALGLAASTNLLAAPVAACFAIYRYGLQRQFVFKFDTAYWCIAALFSSLGVYSAYFLFARRFALAGTQVISGIGQAYATDALGFFGGTALGVGQAWIVAPVMAISLLAALAVVERQRPASPLHLILLMMGAVALMPLIGFAKPRSFLYLAPFVAIVLTVAFDRCVDRYRKLAMALGVVMTACSLASIANINAGNHPFKRSAVIPYQSIFDFVQSHAQGRVLVISTDPVIPWVLRQRRDGVDRCASYFLRGRECFAEGRAYDSIFVVTGHNYASGRPRVEGAIGATVTAVIVGRRKVATLQAGVDEDAGLKSRLTGVPLERHLLTVDAYR
jgi:hypothetical protein